MIEIDCSKAPPPPFYGWSVAEHRNYGKLKLHRHLIKLYTSKRQGLITVRQFVSEFANAPVANGNIQNFYLRNQKKHIPREWINQRKRIYFPGTIYLDALGNKVLRYMEFYDPVVSSIREVKKLYDLHEVNLQEPIASQIIRRERRNQERIESGQPIWRSGLQWFQEDLDTGESICAVLSSPPEGFVIKPTKDNDWSDWQEGLSIIIPE